MLAFFLAFLIAIISHLTGAPAGHTSPPSGFYNSDSSGIGPTAQ